MRSLGRVGGVRTPPTRPQVGLHHTQVGAWRDLKRKLSFFCCKEQVQHTHGDIPRHCEWHWCALGPRRLTLVPHSVPRPSRHVNSLLRQRQQTTYLQQTTSRSTSQTRSSRCLSCVVGTPTTTHEFPARRCVPDVFLHQACPAQVQWINAPVEQLCVVRSTISGTIFRDPKR